MEVWKEWVRCKHHELSGIESTHAVVVEGAEKVGVAVVLEADLLQKTSTDSTSRCTLKAQTICEHTWETNGVEAYANACSQKHSAGDRGSLSNKPCLRGPEALSLAVMRFDG
eukprot:171230-Pelagomonas_calceolata.AAC.1